MRRVTILAVVLGLLPLCMATAQPPELAPSHYASARVALPGFDQFTRLYSPQELQEGVYVGSQFCLACHQGKATWEETLHARFLRRPMTQFSLIPQKGVIADFDANGVDDFMQGLDFNQINSAFDAYKPNAPILSVENGIYYVTVGQLKCPVTFTQAGQGGGSSQRYAVKLPVVDTTTGLTDSNYFAPVQYIPGPGWLPNSPQNWYEGNQPKWGPGVTSADLAVHSGNYSTSCVGCHSTGIRGLGETAQGEPSFEGFVAVLFDPGDETVFDYDGDGNFDLMNIGCESCHGPGSNHILGGGDPEKIINPDEVSAEESNAICGRCHVQARSVPNGTYSWPYDDAAGMDWHPGVEEPLADYWTDATVRWPDGKHSKLTRPYNDFLESSKPTFQFHQVRCNECHDPHDATQHFQIRTSIEDDGLVIPTEVEDNTLCLACHATHGAFEEISKEMVAEYEEFEVEIAQVVEAHSHHPYGPERSMGLGRCTECHMTPMAGHGTLSLPTHTFEAVGPEKTLIYQDEGGMPNACAQSCHAFKVNSFGLGLDPNPNNSVWDEQFDRDLAEELVLYYGPGGIWWDTEEE